MSITSACALQQSAFAPEVGRKASEYRRLQKPCAESKTQHTAAAMPSACQDEAGLTWSHAIAGNSVQYTARTKAIQLVQPAVTYDGEGAMF